jgi:hypothetical protein
MSVSVIKSKTMRWARYVARMGNVRNAYRVLVRKSECKCILEDLGVDRRMLLEYIIEKQGRVMWTGFIRLRLQAIGGPL